MRFERAVFVLARYSDLVHPVSSGKLQCGRNYALKIILQGPNDRNQGEWIKKLVNEWNIMTKNSSPHLMGGSGIEPWTEPCPKTHHLPTYFAGDCDFETRGDISSFWSQHRENHRVAFMPLPLLDQTSLSYVAKRRIGYSEFLQLCIDYVNGLMSLHKRNIIHIDLKPENLMVDRSGKGVIIDFGMAMKLDNTTMARLRSSPGLVSDGFSFGKPEAASTGRFTVDDRDQLNWHADTFSLVKSFELMIDGYDDYQLRADYEDFKKNLVVPAIGERDAPLAYRTVAAQVHGLHTLQGIKGRLEAMRRSWSRSPTHPPRGYHRRAQGHNRRPRARTPPPRPHRGGGQRGSGGLFS